MEVQTKTYENLLHLTNNCVIIAIAYYNYFSMQCNVIFNILCHFKRPLAFSMYLINCNFNDK